MRPMPTTPVYAILALWICSAVPASAISLGAGVMGGVNLGNANVEGIDKTDMRTGLALGGQLEIGVTSPYSLLIEPMYVQKGADFEVAGFSAGGNFDYLEIPVLIKAKFGKIASHLYVFAGPSLGINLAAEGEFAGQNGEIDNSAATTVFSGDIGVGGAMAVSKYVYASADVRYSHGFTNALDEDVATIESWNSRDIRIMAGLLFHLME